MSFTKMAYKIISKSRVNISPGISKVELKKIASNVDTSIVQFYENLSEKDFHNLEEYVFRQRPEIELRVFGHYSTECDLKFLKKFPSLRKLSADCLMNAKNVDYVISLENLEELSIGIYNLISFDFLNDINPNLKKISLAKTASKKPTIKSLSRFKQLEYLYLEGQTNGIEEIKHLKNLQKIVLRSITTKNLNFLSGLYKLWSVDIKLGGIKDFSALVNLPDIKYLELWQINKLADISFISELISLQNLYIQSLRNVETLPNFDKNKKLRRIYLENMKGLKDLKSLRNATALEDFIYVMAQNVNPQDLMPVIENENVKKVFAAFGSTFKNDTFNNLAQKSGKEQYSYYEFKYN
jgi:hypothetical protein